MATDISFWLSLIQLKYPEKKRFFRYQLHQLIWLAYPGLPTGSKQPFLYSLTGQEDENGIYCLVQSQHKPDWGNIMGRDTELSQQLSKVNGVKSVQFTLHQGDQFHFQLTACPIRNAFQGQNKRGIKEPINDNPSIDHWFTRRSEQHGFKKLQYEFHKQKMLIRREAHPNAKDVKISACRFNGILEIEEPQQFAKALIDGIGPKKTFGFGLMMLSRSTPLH
jgi:CRISPR-associated protein Cas6/Cse3/CasE subtype I-E